MSNDIEKLALLKAKFEKQVAGNKIATYNPYSWQKEFHEAGKDHPERMLMAANRCITPWTVLETVPRARRIAEVLHEKEFYVRSWAGESECVAQASGVFLKGIEPAFRILLDNGEWFDCSRKHRVLSREGWVSLGHLIRRASGLRWTQTRKGYRANCGADARLDGEQLRLAAGSDPATLPLPGGAQGLVLAFEREGVEAHISKYSRACPSRAHYSSSDDPAQIEALFSLFEDPRPYISALHRNAIHRELVRCAIAAGHRQSACGGGYRQSYAQSASVDECGYGGAANILEGILSSIREIPRSASLFHAGEVDLESHGDGEQIEIVYPFEHPELVGGRRIIAVVPLGYQPIADFTVEATGCYFAGGVVHHNTGKTYSASSEVAFHLTGEYPDWWQGRVFQEPVLVWTGSPTNETSRDIVQTELLGGLGESLGTGAIPRARLSGKPTTRQAGVKNVVDQFQVTHKSGGVSRVILKTYEQGWQKFQGTAPHVVWLDEEPDDYMIYSESQTRILTSKGIILVTFTPLLGVTDLVEHFMNGGPGIYLKGATWEDAPHLSKEDRDRLSSSYRAHERDARTKGIPMLGEGAVFPVPDEDIMTEPFPVPPHFARIKACDFGIDHPAAGVEIAWDRDQDIVYVIDAYRKSGETAPYHAAWFNKSNRQVPVAWPHDGMNREKAGGNTLADAYREHGVNMLSKSARYRKSPGDKTDKGGPQPVEPIVDEMLERMMTGRFKVFSHLSQWFEEKRSYHRKDGKIVDRRDDILKATMYGLMMKRYAIPLSGMEQFRSQAPQQPIASARI